MPSSVEQQRTFGEIVRDVTRECLADNPRLVLFGLGVNDPGGVFGTTKGLVEEFGPDRVFEIPTSENAMTGVAVGLALNGVPAILTHQRFDFFLLSIDQVVNSAAKWRFMFGGQFEVPITIRLIIGRGWGQGPTHSQVFYSWFRQVPGLRIVVPALASDVGSLLRAAIEDPNPVLFLEHRWLHQTKGRAQPNQSAAEFGKARVVVAGSSITLVSWSVEVLECLKAAEALKMEGISTEVIDLRFLSPIDFELIVRSVEKTKNLLVVEGAVSSGGLGHEIISSVLGRVGHRRVENFGHLACPDYPAPTSFNLTRDYYPSSRKISLAARSILGLSEGGSTLSPLAAHDVPHLDFGPF